ncbi:PAK-box/P21-Rho-binding [Penicillium macrosclerotiorum]|uniref:PAK-box/P21-Rho-binding n=1 Tax=Penicillium macrosclerotiorum TaxID=303699 RepID=UPI002548B844|nr:PAK-box/P21-Rho-binding [Penicillium macrosclerotiorum]KAJ5693372.1 PAK-box/P21-Rho-binding [Penicillium macrosclerotiorum]
MTSIDSVVPSQDERTTSALGMRADKPERSSRSFLARGSRILRRQGSKINIVATLDEEDEIEKPRPEKQDMFGRHRSRRTDHHERLKSIISDPFDFHHLTHTSPSQFQSLDQTRENDLVTEFSVIRASQRPEAALKGIRAEDIHFRNFSADDLAALGTATTVDEPAHQSPPGSPAASGSTGSSRHARRESRIHENFSRPSSRYPRSCPTTPPPPAVQEVPADGAEPAPRAIDEILGLSSTPTYPEYIDSDRSPSNRQFSPSLADDMTARTSSMSSHYDLEDVPEEEDEGTRMWDSPDPSIEGTHSRSASQMNPSLDEAPIASRTIAPKAPLSIFVAEELSRKFSEALGSPTLPQNMPNTPPKEDVETAHLELTPPSAASGVHQFSYDDELYDSWDADIDYCYEHAAESTSDFDWSRTSLDENQRPQIGIACSDENWGLAAPARTRHLQPSPLSTSTLATPDLDPSSALSTLPHSAATPSSTEYERDFIAREARDYFQPVSSSILPSALSKQLNRDSLYEEYLAADAESDRHFPLGIITPEVNNPVSPRSSFSPISKCNSQESLMLSRAASIVRKHRSSVSTTSVPELIYSLSNSRELMPTDRLSTSESLATGSTTSRPPSSSLHRQTKSLAETHLLIHSDSNGSLASADLSAAPASLHDRARSTSEVDTRPVKLDNGPSLPSVPPKNPNRKKSRTPSYSLFPTAA